MTTFGRNVFIMWPINPSNNVVLSVKNAVQWHSMFEGSQASAVCSYKNYFRRQMGVEVSSKDTDGGKIEVLVITKVCLESKYTFHSVKREKKTNNMQQLDVYY